MNRDSWPDSIRGQFHKQAQNQLNAKRWPHFCVRFCVMEFLFINEFGVIQWESIAILVFALAFLVVGVLRTVEFSSIGLKPTQKKIYIGLHLIGCLFFAASMVLGAINIHEDQRTVMFVTFIIAMAFLAPGQFKIGMLRRRLLREEMDRRNSSIKKQS